MENFMFGDCSC